ncbi:MAG: GyrI-like domain-containing protein, partial [Planctomycetota bacterium]
ICKLEAQWWADGHGGDFSKIPAKDWRWNLFIRTPDFVKPEELDNAVELLLKKGKATHVKQVRLESFTEGMCVQMLHVGPYEKECETLAVMEDFAEEQGYAFSGLHHDIYLSDPRRIPPERLKTIIRRPVTKIKT